MLNVAGAVCRDPAAGPCPAQAHALLHLLPISLPFSICLLQYYTPTRAGPEDMTAFHAEDYVDFLRTVTPDNMVGAG